MKNDLLGFPEWYKASLISNPYFFPNLYRIQSDAYKIRDLYGVKPASSDSTRIFRFHVDKQVCFTQPLTVIDTGTGQAIRYLPAFLRGNIEFPSEWKIRWYDNMDFLNSEISISGGHLSVAGAWDDTLRSSEWDMKNAHLITQHGLSMDFHPVTARFDCHYYRARKNNPYGLPVGAHPYHFMDGNDKPFPIITSENLWHPENNPDGYWEPVVTDKRYLDEAWYYTKKLGFVVLWFMHGHSFSSSGLPEPVVFASIVHHNFMRGLVKQEPLWFRKGESWRFEFFGAYEAEYDGPSDDSGDSFDVLQLFTGFNVNGFEVDPFHWIIFDGQAASHCVIKTLEQCVKRLVDAGREDLIKRMICLTDCTSCIAGFEEETKTRFEALEKLGLRLETTESLDLNDLK